MAINYNHDSVIMTKSLQNWNKICPVQSKPISLPLTFRIHRHIKIFLLDIDYSNVLLKDKFGNNSSIH